MNKPVEPLQGSWRQYHPTITPSPLTPDATVTTAPVTSIFVVTSGRAAQAGTVASASAIARLIAILPIFDFDLSEFISFLQMLVGLGFSTLCAECVEL